MNYRHEFHAGNHSEVFKHALLCLLIERFHKKTTPFFVLDTHAGAGLYDLRSPEARRTREAEGGIGKVYTKRSTVLRTYLDAVHSFNPDELTAYPGSPSIIRLMLRKADRLIACELDGAPAAHLKDIMSGDPRVSVHRRNGYEAINAFVPPKERRGFVFIDPPFESPSEFSTAAEAINRGLRKWARGTFVFWYPIKGRSEVRSLRRLVDRHPPAFCCEFLAYAKRAEFLSGSGIVVFNPPWQFDEDTRALGKALVPLFDESGSNFSMEWWTREARA